MAKITLIALVAASLLLGACNSLHTDRNDPDNPAKICKRLHRQMVFTRHDHNQSASSQGHAQRERMRQLYNEYECDKHL